MFSNESMTPGLFASSERKNAAFIKMEAEQLKLELKDCLVLDIMPEPLVILNPERQIVFANRALTDFLHLEDGSSILGMRPGEVFDCVHSKNESGGCGTTEYCSVCGAVNSILHTQRFHDNATQDCHIITTSNSAYNLRIWTTPFVRNCGEYTLLIIRDIADEIRRYSLERIFFHDLINIVSGLYGVLTITTDDSESYQENHPILLNLTEELLEEINSQKDLLAAENDSINVTLTPIWSNDLLKFVVDAVSNLQVAKDKVIQIENISENIEFITDPRLLKRILINMTKNALEASLPKNSVVLKSSKADDKVIFEVYNKGYIQPDVQLQIFNRFYSTKGYGRGLGTYSIKLLAEKYLGGKTYFTSSEGLGTSFFVELPLPSGMELRPKAG